MNKSALIGNALMTVRQVSEFTGFDPETIRVWCRSKKLPHIKVAGGRIRIRPEALENFLRQREVAA